MSKWLKKGSLYAVLTIVLMFMFGVNALASEDDNSLASLGILTEGATVSPEFSYDTWSYTVTVPGGTRELSLDPTPSSGSATISDISGTTLNDDGTGYVTITVQAGNGSTFTYELNVVSDGATPVTEKETETETETETEKVTEKQTEPETEDSQYVRVDRNSLQEAENTITNLKGEITEYKEKVSLFTKIMYGLIGLSVILLFIIINLLLKKKDLKSELNDYRSYGYTNSKKVQKAQKKEEKKQKKAQAEDAYDTYNQPVSPTIKPANMQYGQGQPQPMYPGLDVQPQQSRKKTRNLPQYDQPMRQSQQVQPQPIQAPIGAEPAQSASQPQPTQAPGGAGSAQPACLLSRRHSRSSQDLRDRKMILKLT